MTNFDSKSIVAILPVGLQSSGKSHILNTLAGRAVFPLEKVDDAEQCRHRTVGVDAFVTSDRTILLDMQPLLALSTMDGYIQSEKRTPSGAIDYHQSLESQVRWALLSLFVRAHRPACENVIE